MDGVKKTSDPALQCQQIVAYGQCTNQVVPGAKYCPVHNAKFKGMEGRKNIHSLRLAKWQSQVNHHTESEGVKSLRGEIGVLRLLLENIMEKCQDQNDLLMYSSKIGDLAMKLEKLVSSCDRLEARSDVTMDKGQLIKFAGDVINIISTHITDATIIDKIGDDILKGLMNNAESD
jgi:hypothetical protein